MPALTDGPVPSAASLAWTMLICAATWPDQGIRVAWDRRVIGGTRHALVLLIQRRRAIEAVHHGQRSLQRRRIGVSAGHLATVVSDCRIGASGGSVYRVEHRPVDQRD